MTEHYKVIDQFNKEHKIPKLFPVKLETSNEAMIIAKIQAEYKRDGVRGITYEDIVNIAVTKALRARLSDGYW